MSFEGYTSHLNHYTLEEHSLAVPFFQTVDQDITTHEDKASGAWLITCELGYQKAAGLYAPVSRPQKSPA